MFWLYPHRKLSDLLQIKTKMFQFCGPFLLQCLALHIFLFYMQITTTYLCVFTTKLALYFLYSLMNVGRVICTTFQLFRSTAKWKNSKPFIKNQLHTSCVCQIWPTNLHTNDTALTRTLQFVNQPTMTVALCYLHTNDTALSRTLQFVNQPTMTVALCYKLL